MKMKRIVGFSTSLLGACLILTAQQGPSGQAATPDVIGAAEYPNVTSTFLTALEWREVGPHRGGKADAVAGDPTNPLIFYFGASHGGVWKTEDAGTYWYNVSDGFFNTAPVGAIAVAPSNPAVIYVGTGEVISRPDTAPGDGVYKSIDAGKTWTHVGLRETRHIAKIAIHPTNPDVVYVAALGHIFGHNPDRGVYRTTDGGKTWRRVLFKSEKAGAIDLSMDPTDPRVLYAAIWEFLRQPWDAISGGPDSGLYKSTDGGGTWTDLSGNPGLPKGIKGRIGVAVSPARPSRVWALIEAEDGALFRSDDGGKTWQRISDQRDLRRNAARYMMVIPDGQDPNTVYVMSYDFWKSTDGGATFTSMELPHGDFVGLWVDPRNPQRMINANDGGATVTLNGGKSWSTLYNQPTAALFNLAVDNQHPYRLYAAQNDNSTISTPSRTIDSAIPFKDSYPIIGGGEGGQTAVTADGGIVYAAYSSRLVRYETRTLQSTNISIWPEDQFGAAPKDLKYRFFFTFPVLLSPHDEKVLYAAANILFRTTDEGNNWEAISPDLTRNDLSKMQVIPGGKITSMTSGSHYACLIQAIAESLLEKGELWVGTDDGLVQLSRNGGKSWANVTSGDWPEWTTISTLDVSQHNRGTVYLAGHRYRLGDHTPYLYKTTDYGRTWQKITNGIRENDFTWVIREDPVRPGLLYAGTETGVYVSFNAGASWLSLQRNLPAVPVRGMLVKNNDLVVATCGRGFWILDNAAVLRQITSEVTANPMHLFDVALTYYLLPVRHLPPKRSFRPGIQYAGASGDMVAFEDRREPDGRIRRIFLNAGQNPPDGVVIDYYLKQVPAGETTLTFLDKNGAVIQRFSSQADDRQWMPTQAGMNRFVWDMRYPNARQVPMPAGVESSEYPRAQAPVAKPDRYQVRLAVGGETYERTFEIRKDPRVRATGVDLEAQFALMVQIRDRLSEVTDAVNRLGEARRQLEERERQAVGDAAVTRAAGEAKQKLRMIEASLTRLMGPNPMYLPPKALDNKLAALTQVVGNSAAAPTRSMYAVFAKLSAEVAEQLRQLGQVMTTEVAEVLDRSRTRASQAASR